MTTESADGAEHDALAGPGDDSRIMSAPEMDSFSSGSSTDPAVAGDPADVESSAEATDKSFTAHMDDGEDDSADAAI